MLASPMDDAAKLHCLIEIPKGSRNKYEWDEDLQAIKLNRFLFSSVVYPTDYGFIIDTIGPHGDALDTLVCVSAPTFPGCLIAVRPVAVLRMSDEEGQSDKLVCVPSDDPSWDEVDDLDALPAQLRSEIQHFYSMYKQPEGKEVDIQGWDDREAAAAAIKKAREQYEEKRS
jgi:inorganic pyrophosphatase